MGEHIVDGKFKSDKYDWCEPDFLALKLSDKRAQDLIAEYARRARADGDTSLADDLDARLKNFGYAPILPRHDALKGQFGVLCIGPMMPPEQHWMNDGDQDADTWSSSNRERAEFLAKKQQEGNPGWRFRAMPLP
jgi:hypothetical protein